MSNIRSNAVPRTASFPNPAQDYLEERLSLDHHLVVRPPSTYVLRVSSDALVGMGIHIGDELLVDRALPPGPGQVLVVVIDGERRMGRHEIVDGRAMLVTDAEQIPLTSQVAFWGVATVLLHHLRVDPAGSRRPQLVRSIR